MNNQNQPTDQDLRSFLLMAELEEGEPISQREIAGRLGIALGLVNSYLKTLVAKGYVTIKSMPRNRFAYLLTPRGFAEKSRLAYLHLSNYHKLYRITRQDSLAMFKALHAKGVREVAFCGVDDYTEITYLSLREAGLELATVMDEQSAGNFISYEVVSLEEGARTPCHIVITSLARAAQLKDALQRLGVDRARILAPALSFEEALR